MKIHALILAGGSGSRMKEPVNKVLLSLNGISVIKRTVLAFVPHVESILVVCRNEDLTSIQAELQSVDKVPISYTIGGSSRQASVLNGLRMLKEFPEDMVLIHDGARCMVDSALIMRTIETCNIFRSAVAAVPVSDTIKVCSNDQWILSTPDRSSLYAMQTPQAFFVDDILSASEQAAAHQMTFTDDASLLEYAGKRGHLVPGSLQNIKLTNPEDRMIAETFLLRKEKSMRIGTGYDVHRLVQGRKLILCGVEIPYEQGLLGHSDADVALHALMDSMLGAAALGDIGSHFPDTDERYHGISSMVLLTETRKLLHDSGYTVSNADITIVAQRPKLQPYLNQMRLNIAEALSLPVSDISIKATTTEKLGFEGRMEGISSQAVCMIRPV